MSASEPVEISVFDPISLDEGLVSEQVSSDGSTALRVSEGETSASLDHDPGQPLRFGTQGKPPSEERDSLRVCAILIERLNEDGDTWGSPKKHDDQEPGVDAIAFDIQDPEKRPLRMQVTQALHDTYYWAKVARSGKVGVQTTDEAENLAKDLLVAIHRKKDYPKDMYLVLDARFTLGHADPATVAVFRKQYTKSVQQLGFEAIWVVGPTKRHVHQLDLEV